MRAYEFIKETFRRKAYIQIVHISWLAIYGLLFLIPVPREAWQVWPWGLMLFVWSGCTLPLLISAGIIGDDIASGRIGLIITKPFWPGLIYIYRFFGLSLQALVHIIIAVSMILILQSIGGGNEEQLDQWAAEFEGMGMFSGRSNIENLSMWALSSWLIFNNWVALSVTLSTVLKRAFNSICLFVSIGFVYFLVTILTQLLPEHSTTKAIMTIVRYACPQIESLYHLANGKYSLINSWGCVAYSLSLTAIYGIIGIMILCIRQFECARD
jgi:hypothetical protein